MATPGRSSGGDLASREAVGQTTSTTSQPSHSNTIDAVEMENLSPSTPTPKEIGDNDTTSTNNNNNNASAPASSRIEASSTSDPAQTPLPDKNTSASPSEPCAGGQDAAAVPSPSTKALGKAPVTSPSSPSAAAAATSTDLAPTTTTTVEEDAIGPADTNAGLSATTDGELTLDMMLILPSTGARHPFRINEKYLRKRNVNVTGVTEDGKMDPFSITVYTLKELILREWRKEWEAPPREPASIRLIRMGKMLDDKLPLNQYNFSPTAKSIVHMTVKPQEIVDEEEANKRLKDTGSQTRRSGCCVIL